MCNLGQEDLTQLRPGVTGFDGFGGLYQAPDGSVYQMDGLGQDEELQGFAQDDDLVGMMGVGAVGEVRVGPDGRLYQWVAGVDGLGNPIGFWKALKRVGKSLRRVVRRALPLVRQVAPFFPGGAVALRVATPFLRRAKLAGSDGLGALYQAPDGSLYRVDGFAQDDELQGSAADDELQGFEDDYELQGLDDDYELQGFAADDELQGFEDDYEFQGLDDDYELQGFADDEDLQGFAQDEELHGFADDEDLQGFDQGYVVPDRGMRGLDGYLPDAPPATRWFGPPAQPPELWKPLW